MPRARHVVLILVPQPKGEVAVEGFAHAVERLQGLLPNLGADLVDLLPHLFHLLHQTIGHVLRRADRGTDSLAHAKPVRHARRRIGDPARPQPVGEVFGSANRLIRPQPVSQVPRRRPHPPAKALARLPAAEVHRFTD